MEKVYESRDIKCKDGQELLDMIKNITETYGIKPSDIEVEVGPGYSYGEAYGEAELCFYRPETEAEEKVRKAKEERDKQQALIYKRQQLERLKKELGET